MIEEPAAPGKFRVRQETALRTARNTVMLSTKGEPFTALGNTGILGNVVEVEDRVYIAEPGDLFDNWRRLARWSSTLRGGFFHSRRDGISWSCGNRGSVLLSESGYNELCRSREVLARFKPEKATGKLCRTVQGVCRELMERLHPLGMGDRLTQEIGGDHLHLVSNGQWCFIQVLPGSYPNTSMWDASGYYWELARRLPTPEVFVPENRAPRFGPNKSELAKDWKELITAVGSFKGLRNTLIGCMGAGTREKMAWHKGKETKVPTKFNFFTPAGFLIVRMGYEITQQAAIETGSVFSVGDCIVAQNAGSVGTDGPRAWRERGLPCAIKAQGDAEVFSSTCYKVGPQESEPYKRGNRLVMGTILNTTPPPFLYCDEVF